MLLVRAITEEEKIMINKIFLKMNTKMYYIASSILKSKVDTEDAIAETFLKMIENIERISSLPYHKIEAYCITILKNEVINIIRKRKKLVGIECIEYIEHDNRFYNYEDKIIDIVDCEHLISHINILLNEEKYFIQLRFFYCMSYKEISKIFNISEDAAKKRGQRILEKLRLFYTEN